jgi:predicted DNA-binding transcriptional regulator AlpA
MSYVEVGRMFGKCAKTVRRWIQSVEDFPQPIKMGGSWLLLREEVEALIEKRKEERNKRRKQK